MHADYRLAFATVVVASLVWSDVDAAPVDQGTSISAGYSNQPIEAIVADLVAVSGLPVTFNGDKEILKDRVTVVLRDESLAEAIRKTLRNHNFVLVEDPTSGISVSLIGSGSDEQTTFLPGKDSDLGKWAALMLELQQMEASGYVPYELSPDKLEVVPPVEPGGRGVTLVEVRRMDLERVAMAPEEFEVVPPTKDGERGVTLAQLDEWESLRPSLSPAEIEVVPPVPGARRGMTVLEFEKYQELNPPKAVEITESDIHKMVPMKDQMR